MREPASYPQAIDVSEWQRPGDIDWARLREECGVRRGIVRAGHGDRLDQRCAGHSERILAAGIELQLYHFALPGIPTADQARTALLVAGRYPDAKLWLDVEQDGMRGAPPEPAWLAVVIDLLHRLDVQRPVTTGLYLSRTVWQQLGSPESLLAPPLWVPDYSHQPPWVPGSASPSMWQWTCSRRQPWGGPPLDWSAILEDT